MCKYTNNELDTQIFFELFAGLITLTKKRETVLEETSSTRLFTCVFSQVNDPRRQSKGNYRHSLTDILLVVISGVLCGCNDWDSIALFGQEQESWLRKYGAFKFGIPSHDTLNRVFSALDPEEFSTAFSQWIAHIRTGQPGEVVAIDGKRICNSYDEGRSAIHIVSAFASEDCLCLGQIATEDKSNEITAIPKLLSMLDLQGDIVTIDAMGCQKKIASTIISRGADYILAVKGNQGALQEDIDYTIRLAKPESQAKEVDGGHGRIETRKCTVFTDLSYITQLQDWEKLSSIVLIESERIIKATGEASNEKRFYISSRKDIASIFNANIRKHWSIENNLHWSLDVTFREDFSRKRKDNAAKNFNVILKVALTLLGKDKSVNVSLNRKRMKALLNTEYRDKLFEF
ncbi:putative transposase YncI [Bacteroidia bacterium]|nr:putative transposase YncI [Bacteroidia bacterium]